MNVGPLRFNKAIGRKAIILSFLGFLAVILVTFYMQTLFALSSESVRGKELTSDMQSTITRVNKQADELTAISDARYLNKAQVAAYILDRNPELATKEKLQELSDALMIEYRLRFRQERHRVRVQFAVRDLLAFRRPGGPDVRIPPVALRRGLRRPGADGRRTDRPAAPVRRLYAA